MGCILERYFYTNLATVKEESEAVLYIYPTLTISFLLQNVKGASAARKLRRQIPTAVNYELVSLPNGELHVSGVGIWCLSSLTIGSHVNLCGLIENCQMALSPDQDLLVKVLTSKLKRRRGVSGK